MPVFVLFTNVAKADIPANFLQEMSAVIANTTGKPEGYVSVTVHPDQMMLFGGTNEPCAQGSLSSIGKISKQENIKHSKAIYDKVNSALGIPKDRMYISYVNMTMENTGYNGSTFAG